MKVHRLISLSFMLAYACGKQGGPNVPQSNTITVSSNEAPQSSGNSSAVPIPAPVPEVKPPTSNDMAGSDQKAPMTVNETPCAAGSDMTVTTPVSKFFNITGAAQTLRFQLSHKDCHGAVLPLNNEEIAFDISVPVRLDSWPYEIFDEAGTSVSKGLLDKASGQDIFGPRNNYYLLHTQKILTDKKLSTLYFEVTIGSHTPNTTYPDVIKTFQKIGSSRPGQADLSK